MIKLKKGEKTKQLKMKGQEKTRVKTGTKVNLTIEKKEGNDKFNKYRILWKPLF